MKRILVVEDNEDNLHLIMVLLRTSGFANPICDSSQAKIRFWTRETLLTL